MLAGEGIVVDVFIGACVRTRATFDKEWSTNSGRAQGSRRPPLGRFEAAEGCHLEWERESSAKV